MSNVIDFWKARSERLARDVWQFAAEHEKSADAQRQYYASLGFTFEVDGTHPHRDNVYAVIHDGTMIVDGRAELP